MPPNDIEAKLSFAFCVVCSSSGDTVLSSGVFSMVSELEVAGVSNGLVPAPPPQDATNIVIRSGLKIFCITALPFFGTKKTLQFGAVNKDIIIYISIK